MRINRRSVLLGGLGTALAASPTLAQDITFFRIATGGTAGTYFPIGGLIANAISNPPGSRTCADGGSCGVPGVVATAVASNGSVANVSAIASGSAQSGFTQSDVAYWAFNASGIYEGRPKVDVLRAIANLYPESFHLVARKGAGIKTIKDLKGKRVAVFPGTTQEVFFLERLRMEGMTIKDVEPVRVSFSEMHIALSRGDIDAYVGAEPGPGVSLSSGIGSLVEYPYSTAMGSLNMVFGTHRDVIAQKPDLVRVMLGIHQRATDFAATNKDAMVAMASSKLGQKKEAIEASVPNVELTWKLEAKQIEQSKIYADHMLALKQIKRLPDFATFIDTSFVDAVKPT